MPEFKQFNLSSMIEQLGEERTKRILSSFVCPLNEDVQEFCQKKAIEFSKEVLPKHILYTGKKVTKKTYRLLYNSDETFLLSVRKI